MDKISRPIIGIGVYITVATFYFVATLCADTFRNYMRNRHWYPCKYFSINALSLTFLGIAIKIPTDIASPLRGFDQLAKLSGSVLVCIILALSIPSLGRMEKTDLVPNVVALSILVVTVVVDIGIQLWTGNISSFHKEHGMIMVLMMILLAFVVSTAISVQTIKELLEKKFQKKSNDMLLEVENMCTRRGDDDEYMYVDKLQENIAKYWILAQTSDPQFVISRTSTSIASTILCITAAGTMIESSMIFLHYNEFDETSVGKSDYRESIWMVLVSQIMIIILGTIGPTSRLLWWSKKGFKYVLKDRLKVEEYWVKCLKELKDSPMISFRSKTKVKVGRSSLTALIVLQMTVVRISKLIRFIYVIPIAMVQKLMPKWILRILLLMLPTLCLLADRKLGRIYYLVIFIIISIVYAPTLLCQCCLKLAKFIRTRKHKQLHPKPLEDATYVLHLEGESDFVNFIRKSGCRDNEAWIRSAKKKKNTKLYELINRSNLSNGFSRVTDFDARVSSPYHPDVITYCWALPVATLLCIIVTLPNINQKLVKDLVEAVHEGLKYVRLVDKNLDDRGLNNMMVAAELVVDGIDIDEKFFDVDLFQLRKMQDGSQIVGELGRIASSWLLEFDSNMERQSTQCERLKRPPKILAADCLLWTCSTILSKYNDYQSNQNLFDSLSGIIADIMGACLTNLPQVILMECSKAAIEVREVSVRNAALLFAEVECLLRLLYEPSKKTLRYPEDKRHIDKWHSTYLSAV